MENYFNYFTEIEDRYQRRRGSALLLSTLDWALIETWKDAGIPLEAALRGIDAAFDSYDSKPVRAKTRKVNSLAYCSQQVLSAAEDMKEATTGAAKNAMSEPPGMDRASIMKYLEKNAALIESARLPESIARIARESAATLRATAGRLANSGLRLEDLERQLTVMEEKLFASLLAAANTEELVQVRAEADRDIAPYRSKMIAAQMEQLHRQYLSKRLLERAKLPRLSLFYM